MLLADTLKKACQFFPRKEAIICGNRRWTYEEFFRTPEPLLGLPERDGGSKKATGLPSCIPTVTVFWRFITPLR